MQSLYSFSTQTRVVISALVLTLLWGLISWAVTLA